MKKILINLKDNFNLEENIKYRDGIKNLDVILFPSLPYLYIYKDTNIVLGSQNLSAFEKGSHTGSVSPEHLKDFNIKYVVLNHKECPIDNKNKLQRKIKNALSNEIEIVLCIDSIKEQDLSFINEVLDETIDKTKITIAYEPIEDLTPLTIKEHIEILKNNLKDKYHYIIYGGNISPENIFEIDNTINVDGYFLSRHALNIDKLEKIVHSIR